MAIVRIAGISKESIVDGIGLRYVIFLQGCNHGCVGCQNPSTHDFNGGHTVDTDELYNDIISDTLIDGVTLSGGDPFFQAINLIEFCKQIKSYGLNIWAYTGFKFEYFIEFKTNNRSKDSRINKSMIDLLDYVDIVVDGPFMIDKRTLDLKFRGSSNQRIIDVKKSLENNKIIICSEV